ncbi:MAG: hypothetical protein QG574_4751 [Cyanobacteriota bacterium erpe_2018_sw_21hr_WHONDRS-SW48-000092_B_bin.40]|jgi:hypothetical protein|nr:hypothetical protein [Cyanobacteriota bacterium erpe_2018_sw_21hr_WHONDRS-SW48-000092_B_bin.40]
MTNSPSESILKLLELFELDAAEIMAARKRGKIIHRTKEISQSGSPVENTVRRILSSRLPTAYHVGHGHVLDQDLKTCGQFDVVISDKFANPLMLETDEHCEYTPVEAVYAVGEIKSKYDQNAKSFQRFSQHIRELKTLKRSYAEPNYFSTGGKGRGLLLDVRTSEKRPLKNPIFTFMFFAESDDFALKQIESHYKSEDIKNLPNVVCFLDRGVVMYAQFENKNARSSRQIHYDPEFATIYDAKIGATSRWILQEVEGEFKNGVHLGWLYYLLATHLHYCTLKPLDPMDYANNILGKNRQLQTTLR